MRFKVLTDIPVVANGSLLQILPGSSNRLPNLGFRSFRRWKEDDEYWDLRCLTLVGKESKCIVSSSYP